LAESEVVFSKVVSPAQDAAFAAELEASPTEKKGEGEKSRKDGE